ncbi:MAG: T9SS type A sorting domain-containing protein [Fluviicola sp.]
MQLISIPEPCHENWNDMSITEKGRFCSSCSKVVVDFTDRSKASILQEYLNSDPNGEKICGVFKNSQLAEINRDFELYTFRSKQSFQSAFVFSLMVVFGLTLFSCTSEDQKNEFEKFRSEAVGRILDDEKSSIPVVEISENEVQFLAPIIEEEISIGCEGPEVGIVSVDKTLDELIVYEREYRTMGVPYDLIQYNRDFVLEVIQQSEEFDEKGNLLPNSFSLSAYPNPTVDFSHIEVKVPKDEVFNWYLISSEGKLIQSNQQLELKRGTHIIDLDLLDQPPGIYFMNLQSGTVKETARILKN